MPVDPYDYVNRNYKTSARVGGRVWSEETTEFGEIIALKGNDPEHYVRVWFEGERNSVLVHPTSIKYLWYTPEFVKEKKAEEFKTDLLTALAKNQHRNELVDRITTEVLNSGRFGTFGGGKTPAWGNPVAEALKDREPEFSAGNKIADVVRFVLNEANHPYE
jgi:hypothetical protein